MLRLISRNSRLLLALCLAAQSAGVWAALGEPVSSLFATKSMASSRASNAPAPATAPNVPYQIIETALDSGTRVKEYVSPQGRVFAVTWQGPVLPDFSTLLRNHFPAFKQSAERARSNGVRTSTLKLSLDGLVMRSTGRMGAFEGFAYLPALVPVGVVVDDLLQ